ncbi:hypothetical protein NGA_0164400, partial [Nannochloropsis gaditana CCMP526]
DLVGPVEGWPA